MTTSPAGAINPIFTVAPRAITYQLAFPIETTGTAFRLGVTDPFQGPMTILSASVYSSDSYAGYDPQFGDFALGFDLSTPPTANSVYQTCTTTQHSTTLSCSNTSVLPSGAPMYVIGQRGTLAANTQATIVDGATLRLSTAALASSNQRLQFANLAPECKIYFDNGGADVGTVNTSGVNRDLVIQGNPNSPNNGAQPYTVQWSDFIPCNLSATRADGGTQPLVFVYLTLAAGSTFGANASNVQSFDTNIAPSFGGRYMYEGSAWTQGFDYTDRPTATGFRMMPSRAPFQVFQYLTAQPGWNVVQSGDSISEAPPEDHLSTGIWRACKMLSTTQLPCEWSSTAWGGQTSAVYNQALANNISALQPSALIGQPISRNDYPSLAPTFLASMQNLLAEYQGFVANTDIRIGYYGDFPLTVKLDGKVENQQAVATMVSTLAGIAQSCQNNTSGNNCPLVPVLDPTPIVTRAALGGPNWDYPGIGFNAYDRASPGATRVDITSSSTQGTCYRDDVLTDTTTPSAVAPGAQVLQATPTALTVPSSAIVGPGIAPGDDLVCTMPGWANGAMTYDNKHPWYPAWSLLQPAVNAFMQHLLTD